MSTKEHAIRIAKSLESECGFGTCSGHPDCRDRHCPEHPCNLSLPVLDADYFDQQIAKTSDMPIQYAEDFETNPWWPRVIVVLFIFAIAVIVFSREIAGSLILSR
jgi:hypothetical protein